MNVNQTIKRNCQKLKEARENKAERQKFLDQCSVVAERIAEENELISYNIEAIDDVLYIIGVTYDGTIFQYEAKREELKNVYVKPRTIGLAESGVNGQAVIAGLAILAMVAIALKIAGVF